MNLDLRLGFLYITLMLAGCSQFQHNKKTQIRIVDLQGKPHSIAMRTPDLNLQALAEQGNLSEEKIIAAKQKQSESQPQSDISQNKYANNNLESKPSQDLKETIQMAESPISPQPKEEQKNSEKIIFDGGKPEQSREKIVEYNLTKDEKDLNIQGQSFNSEAKTAIVAKTTKPKISNQKDEIFVQVGSFSILNNAKQELQKITKIAKPSNARIEEVSSAENTIYRVWIGPFANKQKASLMIKKLEKSGNKAIIVKNK